MSRTLRILFVEDSEQDVILLIHELLHGGYEVNFNRVESAEDMRAALDRQTWDIILSDYRMPGFDGLDALRVLQEKELDIPFILVSGAIGEERAAELMRAGARDFVFKGNWPRLIPVIERELAAADGRVLRRKADEEAAYLAKQLSEVQSVAHFGTFEYNLLTDEVRLSDEIYRILGIAPRGSTLSLNQLLAILPLADLDIKDSKIQALLGLKEIEFEHLLVQKDGSSRWVWLCGQRENDAEGNPVCLRGILQDITHRKLVEETLRTSEMLLNRSQEFAGLGSYAWDLRDKSLTWSHNMYAMHGLNERTFAGKLSEVYPQVIHPDDRERVKAEIEAMLVARKTHLIEFRVVLPDGKERIMFSKAEFEYDAAGKPVRAIGMLLDITESRLAEKALQESQANLSALIENIDGVIWAVDSGYRLIIGNALFYQRSDLYLRLTFRPGEDVLPDTIAPRVHAQWKACYDRALQGESFSIERVTGSKDAKRYVEYYFSPIRDGQGKPIGVTVYGRDITERKRVQDDPAGNSENLPHRKLSEREFQVMSMLAGGKSLPEIASALAFSESTARTYRTRILEKLGVRNTAEIIRYVTKHDLAS